jgi:hypothetical protein
VAAAAGVTKLLGTIVTYPQKLGMCTKNLRQKISGLPSKKKAASALRGHVKIKVGVVGHAGGPSLILESIS